jgi:hypothetical protein
MRIMLAARCEGNTPMPARIESSQCGHVELWVTQDVSQRIPCPKRFANSGIFDAMNESD